MELAKNYFADERKDDLKQIGHGLQRSDVPGHVTGKTAYFADRNFPGMLHLKMVRSPHHHARIRSHRHVRGREASGRRARAHRTRTCRTMSTPS